MEYHNLMGSKGLFKCTTLEATVLALGVRELPDTLSEAQVAYLDSINVTTEQYLATKRELLATLVTYDEADPMPPLAELAKWDGYTDLADLGTLELSPNEQSQLLNLCTRRISELYAQSPEIIFRSSESYEASHFGALNRLIDKLLAHHVPQTNDTHAYIKARKQYALSWNKPYRIR